MRWNTDRDRVWTMEGDKLLHSNYAGFYGSVWSSFILFGSLMQFQCASECLSCFLLLLFNFYAFEKWWRNDAKITRWNEHITELLLWTQTQDHLKKYKPKMVKERWTDERWKTTKQDGKKWVCFCMNDSIEHLQEILFMQYSVNLFPVCFHSKHLGTTLRQNVNSNRQVYDDSEKGIKGKEKEMFFQRTSQRSMHVKRLTFLLCSHGYLTATETPTMNMNMHGNHGNWMEREKKIFSPSIVWMNHIQLDNNWSKK